MLGRFGTIAPPLNEYTHPPNVFHHTDLGNGELHPGGTEFIEKQFDDEFTERFNEIELVRAQFVDGEVWLVDDEGNEVGVMARSTFDRCVARPAAGSPSPDVAALAEED